MADRSLFCAVPRRCCAGVGSIGVNADRRGKEVRVRAGASKRRNGPVTLRGRTNLVYPAGHKGVQSIRESGHSVTISWTLFWGGDGPSIGVIPRPPSNARGERDLLDGGPGSTLSLKVLPRVGKIPLRCAARDDSNECGAPHPWLGMTPMDGKLRISGLGRPGPCAIEGSSGRTRLARNSAIFAPSRIILRLDPFAWEPVCRQLEIRILDARS